MAKRAGRILLSLLLCKKLPHCGFITVNDEKSVVIVNYKTYLWYDKPDEWRGI